MEANKKISRSENEHNKMMKILNFRFPHKYKRIGIISAAVVLAFLIATKFIGLNDPLLKDICRTVMLLLLLLASLSKDKMEDEYTLHLRSQSYTLAFICATAYSIGLPLIAVVLDLLISKINPDNLINFHEVSAFEVMFMLICFQLLFFETAKRLGNA